MDQHEVYNPAKSRREKRACWDRIIEDFLSSHLGLSRYCKRHGLVYDHLTYYVRAYKEKQARAAVAKLVPVEITEPEVSATPARQTLHSHSLTLRQGEYTIELHESFNSTLLLEVLKTLRRLPC
jgi:transposase-like protein